MKKMTFVLFINGEALVKKPIVFLLTLSSSFADRLVESSTLKRAFESVYTTFLPKNTHPFAYLSLTIDPANVDVNVHPTKREVQFLHEDMIVGLLVDQVGQKLAAAAASRSYSTQAFAPPVARLEEDDSQPRPSKMRRVVESSDAEEDDHSDADDGAPKRSAPQPRSDRQQTQMTTHFQRHEGTKSAPSGDRQRGSESSSSRPKLPPSKLVRVDSKVQKIDTFLYHRNSEAENGMPSASRSLPKPISDRVEVIDSEEEGNDDKSSSIDGDQALDEAEGPAGVEVDEGVEEAEPMEDVEHAEGGMGSAGAGTGSPAKGKHPDNPATVEDEMVEAEAAEAPDQTETTSPGDRAARPFADVQLTSMLELRAGLLDKVHRGEPQRYDLLFDRILKFICPCRYYRSLSRSHICRSGGFSFGTHSTPDQALHGQLPGSKVSFGLWFDFTPCSDSQTLTLLGCQSFAL
jgi:hypothetical protein